MSDSTKASEDGVGDSPPEWWRVTSWRELGGRKFRHTNWFATEAAARQHAAWIEDGRGEVIAVTKYVRQRP